jgi:RNA polymerase sigma factor (sigma-70 family)
MNIKNDTKIKAKIINESFVWEAFRKGQNWAFSRIFNDYYDQLFYYGIRILNSENEIRDLLQDFFFKIWNKRWRLPSVRNIKAYLYKSFRYMIIDYLRTTKNHLMHEINSAENLPFTISHEDAFIDSEEETLLAQKLQSALNHLTNRQREVIYLRFYHGLEYREIAKIMMLKYQSVRNLLQSALISLRDKI